MKLASEKGIYTGCINNPAYLQDTELGSFLKKKTFGHLLSYFKFKQENLKADQTTKGFVFYDFRNLSHALSFCLKSNENIKWLILVAGGALFSKKDLINNWLKQLPNAEETQIVAYAHLQVPDDYSYFCIHTQMIVINAVLLRKHYKKIIQKLEFNGTMDVPFRKEGDFHDGYTPFLLAPDSELHKNLKVNSDSAWLAELLNLGYSISNFPESVRKSKVFFYMDQKERVALGRSYMKNPSNTKDLIAFSDKIEKKASMEAFLKADQKVERSNYILLDNTNTHYMEELTEFNFDAVILPCAGFNYLNLYSLLKENIKSFFHYDISQSAVSWRKKTVKNFNVKSIEDIIADFQSRGIKTIETPPFKMLSTLYPLASSIQTLNHQYLHLNILSQWKKLLLKVKNQGCNSILFDLSNIMSYDDTIYKKGLDFSGKLFKKIVSFCDESFKNWYVTTDTVFYSKTLMKKFDDTDFYKESLDKTKRRQFYAYLIHNTNPDIPISDVFKVWENSSVNFKELFGLHSKKYSAKKLLTTKVQEDNSWGSFYKNSYLPAVPLNIEFDSSTLLKEARQVFDKNLFTAHRLDESYGWQSFVIHGLGDGKTKSWESYYPGQKEDLSAYHFVNSAKKYCPKTVDFFENEFGQQTGCNHFTRVRFMALLPGGVIPPHYDSYGSTCPGPINMALNNPKNCHFHMWKGSNWTPSSYYGCLPFFPGQALNIDVGNSHMVYNVSNEVRFHIIVHVEPQTETSRKAWYEFKTESLRTYLKEIQEK